MWSIKNKNPSGFVLKKLRHCNTLPRRSLYHEFFNVGDIQFYVSLHSFGLLIYCELEHFNPVRFNSGKQGPGDWKW